MPKPTKARVPNRPNGTAARIPSSRAPMPPRVDTTSAAYRTATSRYIRFMVAMPILLVTSYYLFDRYALGHDAKTLHRIPEVDEMVKK
ncbi:hypothetical protein GGR51DRAFT_141611 [Nemania sp. FL0031]|nr:hypothetical protein GGR51DRAFT_141611 [Nemania sp. FL0031]